MNTPHSQAEAAVLAKVEAAHAIESNEHGFALMRLIVADMQREADANRADSHEIASWAGMLRWLVMVLDNENDDVRDRWQAAGWMQQPGRTGAA